MPPPLNVRGNNTRWQWGVLQQSELAWSEPLKLHIYQVNCVISYNGYAMLISPVNIGFNIIIFVVIISITTRILESCVAKITMRYHSYGGICSDVLCCDCNYCQIIVRLL